MAYIPESSIAAVIINIPSVATSGSIAAFQGGVWTITGSVITVPTGSIITVPSGSIATFVQNFPTTQNVSGSVISFQGTTPWTISSIYGNISGSVVATVNNTVTVVSSISGGIFPISGSVAATVTNANLNVSGSVVSFQSAGWSGSVAATVTNFPTNQNVSGSVVAFPVGNQSVSGAVTAPPGSVASVVNPAGSVTTVRVSDLYQEETVGGPSVRGIALVWQSSANTSVMSTVSPLNPLRILGSVSGTVFATAPAGSIAAVSSTNPAGSITAVSSTAPAGSILATSATQFTTPWVIVGSVYQGVGWSGSVAATITNTNLNVSGSIVAFQGAGWSGSVAAWLNSSNASILTTPVLSTNGTLTSVISSVSAVSILAANTARKGATIYNNSGTNLNINLGTTVTTSVYTVLMANSGYYEVPFGYTGVIAGITASNAGIISVVELT